MSERYLSQIMVPGVGLDGQQRLANARILVVGAGGLGTQVATALWATGVGALHLYDPDKIDQSNLARQIAYGPQLIGKRKVDVLTDRLHLNRPEAGLRAFAKTIDASTVANALRGMHVVCDCTDNAVARLLLDKACAEHGIPLVYAAVRGWQGYVAVLSGSAKRRLTDLFTPAHLEAEAEDCDGAGTLVTTCGVVGHLQANETLKLLLGEPSAADGGVLAIDLRSLVMRKLKLAST